MATTTWIVFANQGCCRAQGSFDLLHKTEPVLSSTHPAVQAQQHWWNYCLPCYARLNTHVWRLAFAPSCKQQGPDVSCYAQHQHCKVSLACQVQTATALLVLSMCLCLHLKASVCCHHSCCTPLWWPGRVRNTLTKVSVAGKTVYSHAQRQSKKLDCVDGATSLALDV